MGFAGTGATPAGARSVAPIWPESIYTSVDCAPVTFPCAPQASCKGCPDSWIAIFATLRRKGHYPRMYDDFVQAKSSQSAVGMAFRNFAQYLYDGRVFDEFHNA